MVVTAVTTAVYCPACGRWLLEAEAITGQRLRCKSCKAELTIDLRDSRLAVEVLLP